MSDIKTGHIIPPPPPEKPVTGGQATVVTPQGDRLQGVRNSDGTVYVPSTKETFTG